MIYLLIKEGASNMKVMFFDDDLLFANNLLNMFKEYFNKLVDSIEATIISDDFSLDMSINADAVFIDIDLNGKNGIALAKYIKNVSPKTLIIFVSSKEELVFNALSVTTFQFIRKARLNEDSIRVFKQLYQYMQENEKKIIIEINGRKTVININDIQFILSFGKDLLIKTISHEYVLVSSIKNILEMFAEHLYYDIVQISRGVAINLNYVSNIEANTVTMQDGIAHTIGRVYRLNLIHKYEEYLLR